MQNLALKRKLDTVQMENTILKINKKKIATQWVRLIDWKDHAGWALTQVESTHGEKASLVISND